MSEIYNIKRFELPTEDLLAVVSQPPIQHRGEYPAKVCVVLHGAVVQISQAGMRTHKAILQPPAGEKNGRCGAVSRAASAVLLDGSTKFRERHQQHIV